MLTDRQTQVFIAHDHMFQLNSILVQIHFSCCLGLWIDAREDLGEVSLDQTCIENLYLDNHVYVI